MKWDMNTTGADMRGRPKAKLVLSDAEREQLTLRFQLEGRVRGEEPLHHLSVLLRLQAAGAVNDHAAGIEPAKTRFADTGGRTTKDNLVVVLHGEGGDRSMRRGAEGAVQHAVGDGQQSAAVPGGSCCPRP